MFQIIPSSFLKQKTGNKKLMKTDAEGTVFEKIEQCLERSVFLPWLAAWRGIFSSFTRY
jgi:hypothetical protein